MAGSVLVPQPKSPAKSDRRGYGDSQEGIRMEMGGLRDRRGGIEFIIRRRNVINRRWPSKQGEAAENKQWNGPRLFKHWTSPKAPHRQATRIFRIW